jgi:hypothetical protein
MTAPQPRFVERRAHERIPVDEPARIYYGAGYAFWADCVVRDISQGGAKIQLPPVYVIPSRFVLLHYRAKLAFEAVRKWRRAEMLGMSFEARHDLTRAPDPRLVAIHQAWLDLRAGIEP